jgi:diguanylate cyclase (GGDEF)-like protein/PAS domain S-box-containing protein
MSNISRVRLQHETGRRAGADAFRDSLVDLQRVLLCLIGQGVGISALITEAARRVDAILPGIICRIGVVMEAGEPLLAGGDKFAASFAMAAGAEESHDPLLVCAREGRPIEIADLRDNPQWPAHAVGAMLNGLRSCAMMPFAGPRQEVGSVALYGDHPGMFGSEHREFMEIFAAGLGAAIAAARNHAIALAAATRFDSLSATIPGVVYQRLVTPDGNIRYTYISDGARDLFGVEPERIINDPEALFRHYDDEYRQTFRKKLIDASKAMTTWDVEAKIRLPDGRVRFTHAIARPHRNDDSSVTWTGVILDASRIKEAEQAAAAAEANTREAIVDSLSQGILLFDKADRLVIANEFFRELYPVLGEIAVPGVHRSDLLRTEYELLTRNRRDSDHDTLANRLDLRDQGTFVAERRLGEERWIMVTEHRGRDGGTVALYTDVSELKLRENRIHHLAFHDVLTGLPNRAFFRQKLIDAILHSSGEGYTTAVLCLDLDSFKSVNDTMGHPTGDELLKMVAQRVQEHIRDTDTAGRLGGDEFAIVLSGLASADHASSLAGRLLKAISEPYEIDGQQVATSTSIGIAVSHPGEDTDPDVLMKNADMALYRAKDDGRNVFRFFEPEMDRRAQARRVLENDLRFAVDRGEFAVFYQPLVDASTEKVIGMEALVRWNHPRRGLVSPIEFISIAEENGMISRIGAFVLRRACEDAVRWPAAIRVAVNLSPAQFHDKDLANCIAKVLAETGLQPSRLEFEITESLLLRNTEVNLRTLNEIKALGVRISMDDFGTGYSSLGNLRSFAFDKIKIDRSFVSDLENNPESAAIVRAVLSLGRGLGMTTTAEGVETRDQLAYLRAEGCIEVQGFYFSEPVSAHEITKILEDGLPIHVSSKSTYQH